LNDAIEFSGGCSMNAPTCRASCWCFTATPTEGYPRGGEFVGRVSPRSGTRRCKKHKVWTGLGRREHNTLHPVWFVLR
jgi:hypothetical protein